MPMALHLAKQAATPWRTPALPKACSCVPRVQLQRANRRLTMAAVQSDVPAEVVVQRQVRHSWFGH
jgi:hypothetical protein